MESRKIALVLGFASLLFSCSPSSGEASTSSKIETSQEISSEVTSESTQESSSIIESSEVSSEISSEISSEATSEATSEEESTSIPAKERFVDDFDYEIDKSIAIASGVGYEIFVESFADSNNDGIGDLNGIKENLDYLKNLGVEYIWLTPIHPSSTYHHYDVEDYYDVSSRIGSVDDFVSLCNEASKYNIKIVMDMVFNHASAKGSWFNTAADHYSRNYKGDDSCKDDFVFLDEIPSPNTYGRTYRSISRNGKTFYYECNFDANMAEFNIDSQQLRDKQKDILSFWISKGAKGFRFDGACYLYYGDKPSNLEYLKYLKAEALEMDPSLYLVAEAWEKNMSDTALAQYYADNGMQAFAFQFSNAGSNYFLNMSINQRGDDLASNIAFIEKKIARQDAEGKPVFFLSNHDTDRMHGYYAIVEKDLRDYKKKLVASTYILNRGTPWIYYGEEVDMAGTRGSSSSDANRRLAFPWSVDDSSIYKCDDPKGTTYKGERPSVGADDCAANRTSIYTHYAKLLNIRSKYPAICNGTYTQYSSLKNSKLCALKIEYNDEVYYLIHNTSNEFETFNIEDASIKEEVTTVGVKASIKKDGIEIAPYSSILMKADEKGVL